MSAAVKQKNGAAGRVRLAMPAAPTYTQGKSGSVSVSVQMSGAIPIQFRLPMQISTPVEIHSPAIHSSLRMIAVSDSVVYSSVQFPMALKNESVSVFSQCKLYI
ncbi:MAG: hypothetical protein HKP58_10310 [Desulfatitalea sp.]|nr:hypothetical protein [Desulfatitalea sp.]NNK00794.1 hypothetical protein [Desulfatitalea sp.]